VYDGSSPIIARIGFEIVAEEIEFGANCFVDIVLI
jgi:hypothetical protein